MNGKILSMKFALIVAVLAIAGCGNAATLSPSSTPLVAPTGMLIPTATLIPAVTPSAKDTLAVAFVKDGNIQLWDESTQQIQTIVNAGDVTAVTMSDDGQVIAFLRRFASQLSEGEWFERSALWAVERDGGNARELVSAESLWQRLNAAERDSTNIPQMEWLAGTHQLLFNGWTYLVQAEGESHAVPQGLYLVDADVLTDKTLIPAGNNLRFVPSPDGRQIALMSMDGLGFINADGRNLRQNVLLYAQVGRTAPLFPTGVWTGDSAAFLITGSMEADPTYNIDFTIWRVPVDGSSPTSLGTVTESDPGSVTFSPDGGRVAFIQSLDGDPLGKAGWFITPLTGQVSPLAIPNEYDFDSRSASLHWSPAGDPFTKDLKKLCQDATRDTDECDTRINFWGTVAAIHWIDGNRVLFLTREPTVLFLGKMDFTGNVDGTTIPIFTWPVEDWVTSKSFTSALNK